MKRVASIRLSAAVAQVLPQQGLVLFLPYDIARLAWALVRSGSCNGTPLRIRRDQLDRPTYRRVISELLSTGVLRAVTGAPQGSAFSLVGSNISDPRALLCALDPFCYVSHLSAMEYHALTDRLPEMLYLSTPALPQWRGFANDRMVKDLGEDLGAYRDQRLPGLYRSSVSKISQRTIHRYNSNHLGAFRTVKEPDFRVATIGRTFLDMLREPDLCGGLMHVLDVFRESARPHLRLILDEIDQHGAGIDKVRAGYILEEICSIRNERIDAWVIYARRGGSRKLNPTLEYSSTFSERWALSINMSIPTEWMK